MSILLTILAGVFGYLFFRGLYKHIWYLVMWRKCRRAILANPHLSDQEKQEVINFARELVKKEEGVDLS